MLVAEGEEERDYPREMLPSLIVGRIGFGMTRPMLIAIAARSLPPQRFATGSAVITMARQIGTVLGVAILVVLIDAAGGTTLGAFRDIWVFVALASLSATAAVLALRTPSPVTNG